MMQVLCLRRNRVRQNADISSKAFVFFLLLSSILFMILFNLVLEPLYFHSDDAFITYNFAKNLAHGFGIVFHPEFPPIQGSSSFLHTLLLAAFAKATAVDVHIIGGLFSVFSYLGLLVAAIALIGHDSPKISNRAKLVVFIPSLFFQLPLLLSYGLEIAFANFLLISTVYFVISRRTKWASFMLLLIPLTRLDYLFYFPSIVALFHLTTNNWKKALTFLIPSMTSTIAYLLFSRFYFGELVPHSWIAKSYFPESVSGIVSWQVFFERYPFTTGLAIAWGLLVVCYLRQEWHSLKTINNWRKRPAFLSLLLLIVTSYLYTCFLRYMGAPNMPWYFITPFCFLYATVAYITPRIHSQPGKLSLFVLLSILYVLMDVNVSQSFIAERFGYTVNRLGNNDRREKIGLYLRDNIPEISHKTVLCYEIGKIAYFSGAKIYDTLGLVSRESLPGLQVGDSTITFLHTDPDLVAGPDLPFYYPMMFLANEVFSTKYSKIIQVDDYVLWQREID